MPHRAPTHNKRPQYGSRFSVKAKQPVSVKERQMEDKLKDDIELIIPNTIAGKLPSKRYAEVRAMKGMTMGDFAALCVACERGEFPGELLYTGTRRQLLDKRYKKLRKKYKQQLQTKWLEMRDERLKEIDKAKELVALKIKAGEIEVPLEQQTPAMRKRKPVRGVRKTRGKPRKAAPPSLDLPAPVKPPESSYTNGNLPEINGPTS